MEIQRLCQKAYNDQRKLLEENDMSVDLIDESLVAMAKLGSWGRYGNNCQRDLLRWLGDPTPPKPLEVQIPIKYVKSGRLTKELEITTGILLPHAEFANLYANHNEHFKKFILGVDETTTNTSEVFWQGCIDRKDPRLNRHSEVNRGEDWQRKGIPIAIHGDAVACVAVGKPGTKSMDTISWASILSAGTTHLPYCDNDCFVFFC